MFVPSRKNALNVLGLYSAKKNLTPSAPAFDHGNKFATVNHDGAAIPTHPTSLPTMPEQLIQRSS